MDVRASKQRYQTCQGDSDCPSTIHAPYAIRSKPEPIACEYCTDAAYVNMQQPDGRVKVIPCPKCFKRKQNERLKQKWPDPFIPLEHQRSTFDSYCALPDVTSLQVQTAQRVKIWATDIALQYDHLIEHPQHWLGLFGACGRGKTGLAVAALKLIMEIADVAGVCIEFSLFVKQCKQAMHDASQAAKEDKYIEGPDRIVARYAQAPVLLIDDIPGYFSPWVLTDVFWPIITARHSNSLPTILTSNASFSALMVAIDHTSFDDAENFAKKTASRIGQRLGGRNALFFSDEEIDLRTL